MKNTFYQWFFKIKFKTLNGTRMSKNPKKKSSSNKIECGGNLIPPTPYHRY